MIQPSIGIARTAHKEAAARLDEVVTYYAHTKETVYVANSQAVIPSKLTGQRDNVTCQVRAKAIGNGDETWVPITQLFDNPVDAAAYVEEIANPKTEARS